MTKEERIQKLTIGLKQKDSINKILIEAMLLHIKENEYQKDFCENVKGMWKDLMNHESFEKFRKRLQKLNFQVFDIFTDEHGFTSRFKVIDRLSSLLSDVLQDPDQKGYIMGYCLCGIIHRQH